MPWNLLAKFGVILLAAAVFAGYVYWNPDAVPVYFFGHDADHVYASYVWAQFLFGAAGGALALFALVIPAWRKLQTTITTLQAQVRQAQGRAGDLEKKLLEAQTRLEQLEAPTADESALVPANGDPAGDERPS